MQTFGIVQCSIPRSHPAGTPACGCGGSSWPQSWLAFMSRSGSQSVMPGIRQDLKVDGVPIVRLESVHLQVDIAPGVGGRVISVRHKSSGYEFLWQNKSLPLELKSGESEYNPN